MITLKVPESSFSKEHPSEEGMYLVKFWIDGEVDLIHVIYYPPKDEYGISWDGYYGVQGMRGRNVVDLQGDFLKVELRGE